MVANTAYRITGVAIGSLRSTGGTEIWAAATKGSDERGRGEKGSDGVFAKLPNWFFGIFWRVLDARIVLQTPACTESSRAGHHSLPCTVMMKLGVNIQRYVQDPTLMERATRTQLSNGVLRSWSRVRRTEKEAVWGPPTRPRGDRPQAPFC